MSFIEILLLFVSFCVISAVIDFAKDFAKAKLMKRSINQAVDTVFTSVIRSMMKYRLDARTVFSKPKEGSDQDEVSDLR